MSATTFTTEHLYAIEDLQFENKKINVDRRLVGELSGILAMFTTFVAAVVGLVCLDKSNSPVWTIVCILSIVVSVMVGCNAMSRVSKVEKEKKELEGDRKAQLERRETGNV